MIKMFKDKKILVTGGIGSIGKDVVRNLLVQNAKVVRILDVDETKEFEFQEELKDFENVRFLLGDLRDKNRLARAVEDIDIIIHAAALKHVLACEYNPFEAIKTNVIGTQNLIDVAMDENVEKVIFTSSDKATNPSNTMGTTKLLAEKLMVAANYYKGKRRTCFSCVRFGNVLGSRGSIVPLIKDQIKSGKNVTLTHHDMTRYIITQSQAVDLIFKSLKIMRGGEVFVMKMPSIKVTDLVDVMIKKLAPKHRQKNVKIEEIGIKAGEKMYEELMTEEETSRALEIEDLYVILPQIKELLSINYSYKNAKFVKNIVRTSEDAKTLSKKEIENILAKEGLLEV